MTDQTAHDLARQVCKAETTSEALVAAALARANATSAANAFVTLDHQGALAVAARIDAQRNKSACPPLMDVPIVPLQIAALDGASDVPTFLEAIHAALVDALQTPSARSCRMSKLENTMATSASAAKDSERVLCTGWASGTGRNRSTTREGNAVESQE